MDLRKVSNLRSGRKRNGFGQKPEADVKGLIMNFTDTDRRRTAVTEILPRHSMWQSKTFIAEPKAKSGGGKDHDTMIASPSDHDVTHNTGVADPFLAPEGDGLPDLLVNQGNVSIAKVMWALQEQERSGVFFGDLLERTGVLKENAVVDLLVHHTRIPFLNLHDYVLDKSSVSVVRGDFCRKHRILPIDKLGLSLTVAMVNPLNYGTLNALYELLPGWRIQRIICSNRDFLRSLERYYTETSYREELPAVS